MHGWMDTDLFHYQAWGFGRPSNAFAIAGLLFSTRKASKYLPTSLDSVYPHGPGGLQSIVTQHLPQVVPCVCEVANSLPEDGKVAVSEAVASQQAAEWRFQLRRPGSRST